MRIHSLKSFSIAEQGRAELLLGSGWSPRLAACGEELLCLGGLAHKHLVRLRQEVHAGPSCWPGASDDETWICYLINRLDAGDGATTVEPGTIHPREPAFLPYLSWPR